jgi:IQ domain-containing protein G
MSDQQSDEITKAMNE